MDEIFYVYAFLDPRKPGSYEYEDYKFNYEPFHIGKGKDKRYKVHFQESILKKNNYKNNKIKKILSEGYEPVIIKVKENILECISFKYEIELIKLIGRIDLGTGPLTNNTNGGDGTSGMSHSKETKQKLSKLQKGRKLSEEHKKKISNSEKGKITSEETKNKISEAQKGNKSYMYGKHLSEETIKKISGENAHNYGKKFSEETIIKLSGENNHMFGKHLSDETKQKMAITRKRNRELKLLQSII